jgi:hypothetical protein
MTGVVRSITVSEMALFSGAVAGAVEGVVVVVVVVVVAAMVVGVSVVGACVTFCRLGWCWCAVALSSGVAAGFSFSCSFG